MRYVTVAGVRLSAVGLGTWQFGSSEWAYGAEYAQDTAPRILTRSLDLGVNLIDTAEIYGLGRSERIVGRALAGRRQEAFVATKLFPVLPAGPVVGWRARGSLRRLAVDAIDLYQVHWPNPVVPVSWTATALRALQTQGLVRHAGVSNFPLDLWQAMERSLGNPVLSNQVRYNLLDRRPERELLPWAQREGRLVMAHTPLAQGLLSGRYDADHRPSGMRARSALFHHENLERLSGLLEELRAVAAAHGATCAQVALAWLLRRPNVVVIPGASSIEQAEANAAAADLELSDDEDRSLTAASDAYRPPDAGPSKVREKAASRAAHLRRRVDRVREGLRA